MLSEAPLLPLMSLPLLSATKPKPSKGAMRSKPSPSLSKSVSFSDMRLLKQRRVEMLASVAVQSFSQSSELQPLEFNPFLDQCLLGGLLEVGRPGYAAEHRAAAEGSVFDPAGLLEEDEAGRFCGLHPVFPPTIIPNNSESSRSLRRASLTCRSTTADWVCWLPPLPEQSLRRNSMRRT